MKKQLIKYLLAFTLICCASQFANAQVRVYVKVRPHATVVARPASPHPGYVWIDEEWKPGNNTYEHVNGYWAAPRKGYVWVPGHWVHENRGDYWVAGHWKKV